MNMEMHDDADDIGSPFPRMPCLARHRSIHGPLCIIARTSGINPPVYEVMFLQGTGGPAVGDVLKFSDVQVKKQFIPVRHSVTFKNDWGIP